MRRFFTIGIRGIPAEIGGFNVCFYFEIGIFFFIQILPQLCNILAAISVLKQSFEPVEKLLFMVAVDSNVRFRYSLIGQL